MQSTSRQKSEELRIRGVVHAAGVGGWHTPGQRHWTLVFGLLPWRDASGRIEESKLRLTRADIPG